MILTKHSVLYIGLGIFLGLLIGVGFVSQYIYNKSNELDGYMYPHVYIDGIDVGNKTKEDVQKLLEKKKQQVSKIKIGVVYKKEPIATLTAQMLNLHTDIDDIIDRAYLVGRTDDTTALIRQRLTTILNLEKFDFKTHVVYEDDELNEFITHVEEQYNVPAKNALFQFEDNKVVTFKPDEKGLKINSDSFRDAFDKTVQEINIQPKDKQIALTDQIIEPEITLAKANNLGVEELIAEGKSDYTHSIPNRIHNLTLAAKRLHGVLIPKGAVFSFNKNVGDISANTGYQPAYVIKNGKTVLDDGGGVCQVSTTMFRAAINSGLPIVERNAHAYRVQYYEQDSKVGFDAAIFQPTVDLKFKNDTPAAILIQTVIDEENNILSFRFFGKKDSRKIEISESVVWDEVPPPPALNQDDPTLPRGVTKQVDFPAWGAKAKFTYKVTMPDGKVNEDTFMSIYRPWQAVFLVGTAG